MTYRKTQLKHDDGELFTAKPRLDQFLDQQTKKDGRIIATVLTEWAKHTYLFARDEMGTELPRATLAENIAGLIREWPPFKDLHIEVKQRQHCAELFAEVVIGQEWDSISNGQER